MKEQLKCRGGRKTAEHENKNGKREVEREEEKTVIKRRCVNPITRDVFEEFCPVGESESVGDSCGGFCGFFCVCLRCRRVCLL